MYQEPTLCYCTPHNTANTCNRRCRFVFSTSIVLGAVSRRTFVHTGHGCALADMTGWSVTSQDFAHVIWVRSAKATTATTTRLA